MPTDVTPETPEAEALRLAIHEAIRVAFIGAMHAEGLPLADAKQLAAMPRYAIRVPEDMPVTRRLLSLLGDAEAPVPHLAGLYTALSLARDEVAILRDRRGECAEAAALLGKMLAELAPRFGRRETVLGVLDAPAVVHSVGCRVHVLDPRHPEGDPLRDRWITVLSQDEANGLWEASYKGVMPRPEIAVGVRDRAQALADRLRTLTTGEALLEIGALRRR